MRNQQRGGPQPRRAASASVAASMHRAWRSVRLDTPIEILGAADVILIHGTEFLVAGIHPLVPGVLAMDLHPVHTWRNGGDWPRFRKRDVPGFTTLESLGLASGLAPTAAFFLPRLSWRGFLAPRVVEGDARMSVDEAFARLPRDQGRRAAAVAKVEDVRALYGRALSDIAYRIENSALFDSGVPTTRQFETALALWSDVTDGMTEDEVVRRSAVVAVAFETARLHAETVGLAHLPATAQDGARRAAGAARLARSSPSDAEREAAELSLTRILRSLAITFLPNPDALPRAITHEPGA